MKRILFITSLIVWVFSTHTFASEKTSFSFIDVNYSLMKTDHLFKSSGLGLKASFELTDQVFISIDKRRTSGDLEPLYTDVDVETSRYALGYRFHSNWYASLSKGRWDLETAMESNSVDIDSVTVGFDSQMNQSLALIASMSSNDVETKGRELGYEIGLRIGPIDSLQFTINYSVIAGDVDASLVSSSLRYQF